MSEIGFPQSAKHAKYTGILNVSCYLWQHQRSFLPHPHRHNLSIAYVSRVPVSSVGRFSYWPKAIPIKDTSANAVSKAGLCEWIVIFSTPQVITTDRGKGHNFSHPYLKSLSTYLGGKRHSYDGLPPMHKRSCGEISSMSKNFPDYQNCLFRT